MREPDLRSFIGDLLDIVFAKTSMPGVVDLADKRNGLGLGDRHNPDPIRISTRALRSLPGSYQY